MTIHWCGTGLSAVPGLRRLISDGRDVAVWNRTVEKAQAAVGDLTDRIAAYGRDALEAELGPGDVVVSMLPAAEHVPLARMAIDHGAHFLCSSYISPELHALDAPARHAEVAVIGEVGLDPGIDHLMAHWLVADYRTAPGFDTGNALTFRSYCGGFPRHPNAFRYKFSWSPLGVLTALGAPSRSIRDYTELRMRHPWEALSRYDAPAPISESFEVYPNRDSLPYIKDYGFDPSWKIRDFVRGTLRLNGWSDAWADVFEAVAAAEEGPEGRAALEELAERLWRDNAYAEDEPDRVVLCVELRALRDGRPAYHKTYLLDAHGDSRGTAMARLVSVPVALAVESLLARELPVGVHGAPSDPRLVTRWLNEVDVQAQVMRVVDHLA